MGEFYTIRISPQINAGDFIFFEADVSMLFPFPIARVMYTLRGDPREHGLRLDLDKQVFIDHLEREEYESAVQEVAPRIATYIVRNMPAQLQRLPSP